ncbi:MULTISPECIES: hypothetical protein [Novacetimonas]|uniref:DUF945 domain-containing protein n=2 Tax=Novacetimonas hansenii TaxID=436 RepID=A0AAW5ENP4_NOVHA|nr:hypothetical protein [Novacetimonas hansenii]EFG85664.1 hypothetical protein GXY_02361 [Novacetimonas hansenii ATCC 23769]MCJ8353446.1 hypothetical protein [Novacetimonas hansenii]WEQ57865.1 hypothetical protein LV563_08105 [Novacetimonas hansenii]CUW46221.1 hypothetical protein ATCC53582_00310 [Novacetimonas hansenii]GAN84797.1 hypothetical protein Gaha_0225_003 [Novacetimonas hansenii JCM 7643]
MQEITVDTALVKKIFPALPMVALVLVVGGWGLHHFAQRRLEAGIADFRAAIGPDASFSYATAKPRTLARGARFTAVTYHNPAMTLTAASVRLGGMKGNNVQGEKIGRVILQKVQVMAWGNTFSLDEVDLSDLTLPNGARPAGDTPQSLGFDSLVLGEGDFTNLHIAAPATQTDMTVAHMRVSDYGLGLASHLVLDHLATQINLTPTRRITVDHMQLDGPDFAGQVASLTQSGHLIHETHPYTLTLTKGAIDSSHPLLQVDKLVSSRTSTEVEDKMDTRLTNLAVWSTGTDSSSLLNAFGYDHFMGNVHVVSAGDRTAGHLRLEPLSVESPDMGNLTVIAELDQIPFDDMTVIPETARVVSAAITWDDRSLAGHVIESLARSRNVPVDEYRRTLLSGLAASDDASMRALGRFLQSPADHPLQLALRPMKPVNLMMIGIAISMASDPSIAAPLGLTISTP